MSNFPYGTHDDYEADLRADLHAQLCCAWEEWVEQHMEADESRQKPMKASKASTFHGDEIMIVGHDGSINHYRFSLERLG